MLTLSVIVHKGGINPWIGNSRGSGEGRSYWIAGNLSDHPMKHHQEDLTVTTRGRGFTNLTSRVASVVEASGVKTGICVVFVQHTSASLVIQENADPAVRRDMETWIARVAPEDARAYEHDAEGEDDMPAHLRAAMTNISETIPITNGRLALGTWQALYLWEHRKSPHTRTIVVHVQGL